MFKPNAIVKYLNRLYSHFLSLLLKRLHEKYSKQVGENRLLPYPTFVKYMRAYHIDVAIARAKEDCCDTCMRLSIAAADPNIGEEELRSQSESIQTMLESRD
jgi:hypothetical protein